MPSGKTPCAARPEPGTKALATGAGGDRHRAAAECWRAPPVLIDIEIRARWVPPEDVDNCCRVTSIKPRATFSVSRLVYQRVSVGMDELPVRSTNLPAPRVVASWCRPREHPATLRLVSGLGLRGRHQWAGFLGDQRQLNSRAHSLTRRREASVLDEPSCLDGGVVHVVPSASQVVIWGEVALIPAFCSVMPVESPPHGVA